MAADTELFRLLHATMRIVDRHAERKEGSGLLHVPLRPHEMKELRASLEPFRERYRGMMGLNWQRLDEIQDGAPPTPDEQAVRLVVRGRQIPQPKSRDRLEEDLEEQRENVRAFTFFCFAVPALLISYALIRAFAPN